jgi:DNA invertase Pin-like site-specific DNA recombinase
MKIGYARVSTEEQNLDLQRHALIAAGCETVYEDAGVPGAAMERPGLAKALSRIKSGDVLVVWKLDRLSRSLRHLIEIIGDLEKAGAGFQCIDDDINTTTPGGRLVFQLMGALAEFEREMIRSRTRAGMQAARRRGVHVGRPSKLTAHQVEHARELIGRGGKTRGEVAALLGVAPKTLWRALLYKSQDE